MSFDSSIRAAIFDMDGLLIDSEPLWDKAELEVIASLGVDISLRHTMKDTLGLRIDMVVELWYQHSPLDDTKPGRGCSPYYRSRHRTRCRTTPASARRRACTSTMP